jgi:REP element-mobilizing transposase RayT
MSRPLRIEIEDGLYHVTVRGWERRSIVRDDRDRADWLRLLDKSARRCQWRVFSWVLMTNHFHLYLRTPQPNLSAGMHDLNSGYASLFNRRHRRCGSLCQGRYKGILVEDESHSWELSRYVHLNPVRAKMVARPEDYPWSSYPAFFDRRKAPDWLDWKTVLLEHGTSLSSSRRAYRRFVEAGMQDRIGSPLKSARGGMFLGSESWIDVMRRRLAKEPDDRNVPSRRRLARVPRPAELGAKVAEHFNVSQAVFADVRRRNNDARTAAIYLHRKLTGESVGRLAERYGGVSVAAISKTVARAEARRSEDRTWDRTLSKIEQSLIDA